MHCFKSRQLIRAVTNVTWVLLSLRSLILPLIKLSYIQPKRTTQDEEFVLKSIVRKRWGLFQFCALWWETLKGDQGRISLAATLGCCMLLGEKPWRENASFISCLTVSRGIWSTTVWHQMLDYMDFEPLFLHTYWRGITYSGWLDKLSLVANHC